LVELYPTSRAAAACVWVVNQQSVVKFRHDAEKRLLLAPSSGMNQLLHEQIYSHSGTPSRHQTDSI
jgi:hypothetical protein